ncbi:MAG TPA: RNA 2',3'-cyclic phosphodiesterase, partial [Dehalococcoidia bacterium]|nr:RNA 2',3'-cyclic phosphodiesterase [Dehalococcoidia bacterium]
LRLFVAVELPAAAREALARTAGAMRAAGIGDGLRWVRPEGIHITLKFLGATPARQADEVAAALRRVAARGRPLQLQPGGLGSFGGRRSMRVVWLGIGGETDALAALAASVDEAVSPFGFEPERRPFAAHLTLARVREAAPPDERARLHAALAAVETPAVAAFIAGHLSLMRSTLSPSGARYEALATFRLGGPP